MKFYILFSLVFSIKNFCADVSDFCLLQYDPRNFEWELKHEKSNSSLDSDKALRVLLSTGLRYQSLGSLPTLDRDELLTSARYMCERLTEKDRRYSGNETYSRFAKENFEYKRHHYGDRTNLSVLTKGGVVVGVSDSIKNNNGKCSINSFVVAESIRRTGAAKAFLTVELEKLRHSGCNSVSLAVHPENTRAKRFYQKSGFNKGQNEDSDMESNFETFTILFDTNTLSSAQKTSSVFQPISFLDIIGDLNSQIRDLENAIKN